MRQLQISSWSYLGVKIPPMWSGACYGVKSPVVARSCKHACCITSVSKNMSFKTRNSQSNHRRRRLSSGKMCVFKYRQCSGMQHFGPQIPDRNSSYFHPWCEPMTIWHHHIIERPRFSWMFSGEYLQKSLWILGWRDFFWITLPETNIAPGNGWLED